MLGFQDEAIAASEQKLFLFNHRFERILILARAQLERLGILEGRRGWCLIVEI